MHEQLTAGTLTFYHHDYDGDVIQVVDSESNQQFQICEKDLQKLVRDYLAGHPDKELT